MKLAIQEIIKINNIPICNVVNDNEMKRSMSFKFVCLLFICFSIILSQDASAQSLVSPCPKIFVYEPPGTEPDKWYGTVTLITDADLVEVWLTIIFDNPPLEVGNWFGEVRMQDSTDYLIRNRKYKLLANIPLPIRFYVRYDPSKPIAQVATIRLNARPICPEYLATSAPPISSNSLSTTNATKLISSTIYSQSSNPAGSNGPSYFGGDDDFFPGDFSGFKIKSADVESSIACGTVAVQPSPLITSGQKTKVGEFPWHAALYHSRNGDANYTCGGSLISKYHVLTAAHCVSKPISQTLLNPEHLLVYLGKYYLRKGSNPGLQSHKVSKITRHPEYDSLKYANDIAVIRLSQPANFTNFVRPVCLWEGSRDVNHLMGKFGTVVGWGYDEHGKLTEELTMLNMPVVSKEVCIYSLPDFYPRFTTPDTYCAGFTNGSSACNGDSGGGMVFQRNTGNPKKKAYHLRGLISLSVALQNAAKCDPTHYVVFTDVAKYLEFIKQATIE